MMNRYIHPIQQPFTTQSLPNVAKNKHRFKEILKHLSTVKISKHAQTRLQERNIKISDEKWEKITEKMLEAKLKGVTDALVVTDDVTLVVSTKNNTVVTALHSNDAENKIFTNINGTILL